MLKMYNSNKKSWLSSFSLILYYIFFGFCIGASLLSRLVSTANLNAVLLQVPRNLVLNVVKILLQVGNA